MKMIFGFVLLFVVTHGLDMMTGRYELSLEQGKLIATIPVLAMSYKLSFDLKPKSYAYGFHSVLHFTVGDDLSKYGDRTPALWFRQYEHNSNGLLHIAAPINGNPNGQTSINALPLNVWTNVVISQQLVDNKYVFTIGLNGTNVFSERNNKPQKFDNVRVYVSDPWYPPHNGSIKNLILENGEPGESLSKPLYPQSSIRRDGEEILKKNNLIALLSNVEKSFYMFFQLILNKFSDDFRSVIHFTIGEDNVKYGDRIPGIWIFKEKLHVGFAISGEKNEYFVSKPLLLDEWINIEIWQRVELGMFYFSVFIDDVEVYKVQNLNAQVFKGVNVFAGDPWYEAQDGAIRDFLFKNKN